jgi:hypothetical protein
MDGRGYFAIAIMISEAERELEEGVIRFVDMLLWWYIS